MPRRNRPPRRQNKGKNRKRPRRYHRGPMQALRFDRVVARIREVGVPW